MDRNKTGGGGGGTMFRAPDEQITRRRRRPSIRVQQSRRMASIDCCAPFLPAPIYRRLVFAGDDHHHHHDDESCQHGPMYNNIRHRRHLSPPARPSVCLSVCAPLFASRVSGSPSALRAFLMQPPNMTAFFLFSPFFSLLPRSPFLFLRCAPARSFLSRPSLMNCVNNDSVRPLLAATCRPPSQTHRPTEKKQRTDKNRIQINRKQNKDSIKWQSGKRCILKKIKK